MNKSVAYWTRWLCLPTALVVSYIVCILLALTIPITLSSELWWFSTVGFMIALIWMLIAFFIMPDHKIAGALACLIFGGALSWILMRKTYWPDYSGTTRLATYITWAGGVIGFVGIMLIEKRKNKKQSKAVDATD